MKIAIFNWRDIRNPKAGGAELYFHEMAKRWIKSENEVTWISAGWKGCKKNEEIDGINIYRTGNEFSVYIYAAFKFFSKAKDADVIIDIENGIPFFTPIYARNKKVLHIHHIHKDVWFREAGKNLFMNILAGIGYSLENWLMPFIYRKNKVVTLSKSSAREILNGKYSRYNPEIINPGVEFYEYKKVGKNRRPIVLYLNRIKKYKGVKVLVDAARELYSRNNKIDFWIAGAGDDLNEMIKYAKQYKINNVKFLGRVSEEKKAELMQKAWIFANPSSKEGWGIVNVEANYFGTPVIGSDVHGIRDSVLDGKTGLLFKEGNYKELADKIEYLVKNNKERTRMGKEGMKWARKYGWDKVASEYLNILHKTAAN